jgi:hypothetical protein
VQQHLFELVFGDSVLYHALLRVPGQCNIAKPWHVGEVVLHGAIVHSLASNSRLPLAERIHRSNRRGLCLRRVLSRLDHRDRPPLARTAAAKVTLRRRRHRRSTWRLPVSNREVLRCEDAISCKDSQSITPCILQSRQETPDGLRVTLREDLDVTTLIPGNANTTDFRD